jgi:hypothetical protein
MLAFGGWSGAGLFVGIHDAAEYCPQIRKRKPEMRHAKSGRTDCELQGVSRINWHSGQRCPIGLYPMVPGKVPAYGVGYDDETAENAIYASPN